MTNSVHVAITLIVCAAFNTAALQAADDAATKPAGDASLIPLEIELPKPLFIGTPKNIVSANLEEGAQQKRPAFMVPKGLVNLALDKEVESTDDEPIVGEVELITNGVKDGADGNYVELGPGLQHITIDLEETCEIFAVVIWHYHAQAQVYHDVVVKVGADPDFILDVKTIFNNDHDNSAGLGIGKDKEYIETYEGRLIDAKGAKGRYLRLYSNGNTSNDLNHYIEVAVYGRPVQ